ncbi:RICIN domain-containing protein [Streptomyces celluloflavus]|uniref:RICIN domain-containing protein n=1 Tax=Streptomyces celluloflavus TaxID=58344 RepID=UPI003657439C
MRRVFRAKTVTRAVVLGAAVAALVAATGVAPAGASGPRELRKDVVTDVSDVFLIGREAGMRWETYGGGTSVGTEVTANRRDFEDHHFTWELIDVQPGKDWMIRHLASEKCVRVASTDLKARATLQECASGDDNQRFRFENDPATVRGTDRPNWPHDDNAGIMIKPVGDLSKALTLENHGDSTWTFLELNRAVASTSQLWRVIPNAVPPSA